MESNNPNGVHEESPINTPLKKSENGSRFMTYIELIKECIPNILQLTIYQFDAILNVLFIAAYNDKILVASVGLA